MSWGCRWRTWEGRRARAAQVQGRESQVRSTNFYQSKSLILGVSNVNLLADRIMVMHLRSVVKTQEGPNVSNCSKHNF